METYLLPWSLVAKQDPDRYFLSFGVTVQSYERNPFFLMKSYHFKKTLGWKEIEIYLTFKERKVWFGH